MPMLHLLPMRFLMTAFAAVVGGLVVVAFYAGYVGGGSTLQSIQIVVRWASVLSICAIALLCAAWRWLPFVQSVVFPYLGGKWEGQIRYNKDGEPAAKNVTLDVRHTLLKMTFLLESDESSSVTLAVHAEKESDFNKYLVYYIFLNRRKEGVEGAGESYRGLAIVRWAMDDVPFLEGNYFTDALGRGTLHLRRISKTRFWKLWR